MGEARPPATTSAPDVGEEHLRVEVGEATAREQLTPVEYLELFKRVGFSRADIAAALGIADRAPTRWRRGGGMSFLVEHCAHELLETAGLLLDGGCTDREVVGWARTPTPALVGRRPLDVIPTPFGGEVVREAATGFLAERRRALAQRELSGNELAPEGTYPVLEVARAAGRQSHGGGAKALLSPEQVDGARSLIAERDDRGRRVHTRVEVAGMFGVSYATLHRALKRHPPPS